MGRGRKGLIIQSERRAIPSRGHSERGMPMTYFVGSPNREIKKVPVPEQAIEFMKNMNQQQLADFLLSNDDWHVKTSSGNASGN